MTTVTQTVYAAIQKALTGPALDPRRNGSSSDRLEYVTDIVCADLAKHFTFTPRSAPVTTTTVLPPSIAPGKGIVVSFGAHGEQYAHVIPSKGNRTRGVFNHKVRIWRATSKKWTKPRKLQPAEYVRMATDEDLRKFKPEFGPIWEQNW